MPTVEAHPVLISDADKKTLTAIKGMEKQYADAEIQLQRLGSDIDFYKKKLNISWQTEILKCLEKRKDFYGLKTSAHIIDCIGISFGITPSVEMKRIITTTLSNLFKSGKIGRIEIDKKGYYGIDDMFNPDMKTLKNKYHSYIDQRRKNP